MLSGATGQNFFETGCVDEHRQLLARPVGIEAWRVDTVTDTTANSIAQLRELAGRCERVRKAQRALKIAASRPRKDNAHSAA